MARDCKAGKAKNANGRCVKIKTQAACKGNKVRNEKGRCVTPRRKRCENGSRRNKSGICVKRSARSKSISIVRQPRGAKTSFAKEMQRKKKHLKHYSSPKSESDQQGYGMLRWIE